MRDDETDRCRELVLTKLQAVAWDIVPARAEQDARRQRRPSQAHPCGAILLPAAVVKPSAQAQGLIAR